MCLDARAAQRYAHTSILAMGGGWVRGEKVRRRWEDNVWLGSEIDARIELALITLCLVSLVRHPNRFTDTRRVLSSTDGSTRPTGSRAQSSSSASTSRSRSSRSVLPTARCPLFPCPCLDRPASWPMPYADDLFFCVLPRCSIMIGCDDPRPSRAQLASGGQGP